MSIAGILASNLFSEAGNQIAQKLPLSPNQASGAQSAFSALQQKLSNSGSTPTSGVTSLPAQLAQVGQDLKSGNLSSAQADFSAFKMTLAQSQTELLHRLHPGSASSGESGSQPGLPGITSQAGAGSDPLTEAMLAYSSLQQNPTISGLSTSLSTPASTFSINA